MVSLLCMIVGVAANRQTYIIQTEPKSGSDVTAQAVTYQKMVSEALQFTSAGLKGTLAQSPLIFIGRILIF